MSDRVSDEAAKEALETFEAKQYLEALDFTTVDLSKLPRAYSNRLTSHWRLPVFRWLDLRKAKNQDKGCRNCGQQGQGEVFTYGMDLKIGIYCHQCGMTLVTALRTALKDIGCTCDGLVTSPICSLHGI